MNKDTVMVIIAMFMFAIGLGGGVRIGRESLKQDILCGKVAVVATSTNTTATVIGEIVDLYVEKP